MTTNPADLDLPRSSPLIILEWSQLVRLVVSTLPQCPLGISPSKSLSVQLEFLLVGSRGEWESFFINKLDSHRSSEVSYDLTIS
jgi:hypothetical protein